MTEITFTGVVDATYLSPGWVNTYGIDGAGVFGPVGASLVGDAFSATFTGDYATNTVYDATLTINGYTYDFGTDIVPSTSEFVTWGNVSAYQLSQANGGQFDIDISSDSGGYVAIAIGEGLTHAYLTPVAIPSPIVGTGPLAFAFFLFLAHRHLRRWGCL